MLRDAFLLHIRRMLAIVRKELLVLFCNPISRMLLIVPPLMQIIVFGWAATMEVRNVDVAVLDHDEGPLSREIVRRLEGSPTFRHVFFLRGQQDQRMNNLFNVSSGQIVGFQLIAGDVFQSRFVGFNHSRHDDIRRNVTYTH